MSRRRSVVVAALLLVLAVAGWAFAWRPSLDTVAAPLRSSFDVATLTRGANLAALGNCATCHTSAEGAPFAGGLPIATPFGTLYSTNITPDAATGLGGWSRAAFVRAMREGVARDGRHLYPAFPYDHYTRLTDADLDALYGFVMTRTPVASAPPPNRLRFPFGFRPLLAGWKLLYFRPGPFVADASRGDDENRGAYLVDALAHCGSCHTPRNRLGAERRTAELDGGFADGWYAPPIDAHSPSPLPWDREALASYLRTGLATDHAMAGGPMHEVVGSLGSAAGPDVRAIAAFIVGRMQPGGAYAAARTVRAAGARQRAERPLATSAPAAGEADDDRLRLGATVYASACANCHDLGRGPSSNAALQMPLAVALYEAEPGSLLRIVRDGIGPDPVRPGRVMPAFGGALGEPQLVALAAYLRQRAAAQPPWERVSESVHAARTSAMPTPESP